MQHLSSLSILELYWKDQENAEGEKCIYIPKENLNIYEPVNLWTLCTIKMPQM